MVANENVATITVRPYSYKELIILYGVSQRTFKTWLEPFMAEIGEKRGRYFTVRQTEVIFKKLGFPKNVHEVY
jgi:hypothetical protein